MGKSIQDTLAGYSKWDEMNDIPGSKKKASPYVDWTKMKYNSLFLVACAYYKIVSSRKWHHTGEIFQIGRYLGPSDSRKTFNLRWRKCVRRRYYTRETGPWGLR
jgi:hypothetical protein